MMEFDFSEAALRISSQIAAESNEKLRIILEKNYSSEQTMQEIIHLIVACSTVTSSRILEEYHQSLMQYLSQKGL